MTRNSELHSELGTPELPPELGTPNSELGGHRAGVAFFGRDLLDDFFFYLQHF